MDIFPELLGETEFQFFNDSDFEALRKVLDATTASYILEYLNSPQGDAYIKSSIREKLMPTLESLTFHIRLKESGLVELVRNLNPESLAVSNVNLDELITQLSFLEENVDKIRTTIPARTSASFNNFISSISGVVARVRVAGKTPTYPDIVERIKANKFLFYVTGERDHATGVGLLNSKKRQWVIALNGARWLKYCNEKNISAVERSKF